MKYRSQEEIMAVIRRLRKQPVSRFAGITVDMDYELCIPSVHAVYLGEEMIVDMDGGVRKRTEGFPEEKAELLLRWVRMHKQEILGNHWKVNHEDEPLIQIEPLEE